MTKPASIRWVEEALACVVDEWSDLFGGMSSEVRRCASGERSFVVRHITDLEWRRREPWLVDAEATALALLSDSHVRAPDLLAHSSEEGMLAMSWMEGRLMTSAGDVSARAGDLGRLAASIAAVPLPNDHGLPAWRSWAPDRPAVPTGGDDDLWRRGFAVAREQRPTSTSPAVLLHRDLHPLNVLWPTESDPDRLPVIVDWVNACVGHPHAELGHGRWNLMVLAGMDAADAMLGAYLECTGFEPYSRWWDVAAVMSLLPMPIGLAGWHAVGRTDLTPTWVLTATERFLELALASVDR